MNLRMDRDSIRIRVSQKEFEELNSAGFLETWFPLTDQCLVHLKVKKGDPFSFYSQGSESGIDLSATLPLLGETTEWSFPLNHAHLLFEVDRFSLSKRRTRPEGNT